MLRYFSLDVLSLYFLGQECRLVSFLFAKSRFFVAFGPTKTFLHTKINTKCYNVLQRNDDDVAHDTTHDTKGKMR